MILKNTLIIALFFISSFAFSQSKTNFTISGTIKDASSGEDMIGAMVQVKELSNYGAVTNVYGFYSISLPKGNYTLIYSYIGFEKRTVKIKLDKDIKKNVNLISSSQYIEGVEITGERSDANVTSPEMSVTKVTIKEVEKIPVIFGEKDVMKSIQLLPGI